MGLFQKLNKMKSFKDLTEQEFSWVLYDVGNSAYTMLACSLIPIWYKNIAVGTNPGQIDGDHATAYYSLAISIVTLIVALLGPVIGAFADHKDQRKVLFNTVVALGVVFCIINGFINAWLPFLIIYVVTKTLYSSSLTIYDSMLNDVTTELRLCLGLHRLLHPLHFCTDRLCFGSGHGWSDLGKPFPHHRLYDHRYLVAACDPSAADPL